MWPDSEFNRSFRVINDKFMGADQLMVIVETAEPYGLYKPAAMHEIESFQRYMEQDPNAGGSFSIVDFLKLISRTFHNADPRWLNIPYTQQEIGGLLYLYEAGSPDPRIFNAWRD